MTDDPLALLADHGYPEPAFLGEVGSTVHGLGISNQDDLDLTAIRFEPWTEFAAAFANSKAQSLSIRTQPDGHRSGPGDIDINLYTVRKFAELALKLNPSILNVLYLPRSAIQIDGLSMFLHELTDLVRSREAGKRYLGYMRAQIERWRGERGQKNVTRPELVEAYGYDTKYAAHIIRLGFQGSEYLRTGHITIPMHPVIARMIRNLRIGRVDESDALAWAHRVEQVLIKRYESSTLPEHPDHEGVWNLVADTYATHYAYDSLLKRDTR